MISNYTNKRFDKWLKRRIPAHKEITLNSRNLFIFPSKSGIHFLLSCFILFLLGTNYQNNLILFMVFFLCSFMITCLLLSYRNLADLTLKAVDSEAQFAGQDSQFMLRIVQHKNKAQGLRFKFRQDNSDLQPIIQEDRVTLYSKAQQRGYYSPGRITVRSTFPFGLYNVWTHIDFGLKVLLYPEAIENKLSPMAISQNSAYDSVKHAMPGVDQLSTLKSYQQGESLKSVAWKQLAQGRGWLSKQFEQMAGGDLLLDIDTLTHLPFEKRLSFLCYQIVELEKRQQRYALELQQQKIEVGSGSAHKARCLKALALFKLQEDKR